MPTRANSHVRKMQILQFCLLASKPIMRARTPYFGINSNRFGKPWSIDIDYTIPGQKEDIRHRVEESPSRKIFREYVDELIDKKLLIRIITKDKRSKFYSITPLGICHLIKSDLFFDGIKYPWPEKLYVMLTLMSFAAPNVKPYKSMILEGTKFITYHTELWKDLGQFGIAVRHQIPHVFSNFESEYGLNFYITNGYEGDNKYHLANIEFIDNKIIVNELGNSNKRIFDQSGYIPLEIDDEQFHHYLANLLLYSFIYDSIIALYDMNILRAQRFKILDKIRKENSYSTLKNDHIEDLKLYPEYFIKICFLFSKHISSIVKKQNNLLNDFNQNLNIIQFK